jgi:hypothetical protein
VGRFELIGQAHLSLGYFHHAPELVHPAGRWQPSAGLSAGFGF